MLNRPKTLPEVDPPDGGTITKIKPQVHDSNRFSIFLDGDFAFGLHVDVVTEADLQKGLHLDRERCSELLHQDLYYRAWSRALDYIAHRPRTTREVHRRLSEINTPDEATDRILSRLEDLGYLDDQDYAERYVKSRARSKGYGPVRIRRELMQRGISRGAATRALEQLSVDDMRERLEDLARKALRKYEGESDEYKRRRKMTSWLARRGYPFDEIRQVIDEVSQ